MELITCAQRSDEWFAARLGRLTGSVAGDMLATIKSGEAAARRNLRVRLVLERITGRSQDRGFISQAMQDGIDREAEALSVYEALSGAMVSPVGFIARRDIAAGVSPDGLVGDLDGMVEVKCPTPAIHLEYLKTGVIPKDYRAQIVHGLWVTGLRWCDWMSYQPDFPEPLQTKLVRVARDESEVSAYGTAALAFLAEVDREVEAVRTMVDMAGTLTAAARS